MLPLKHETTAGGHPNTVEAAARRWRCNVLFVVIAIPCAVYALLFFQPLLERHFGVNLFGAFRRHGRSLASRPTCNSCEKPRVIEGEKYVRMEYTVDTTGDCSQLKVICGLDRKTEAIVQWSRDGTDLGVSFNDHKGQTKIERTLKCSNSSLWLLTENGATEGVNELSCIVAMVHEEL